VVKRGYYYLAFVVLALCVVAGVVFWSYNHPYVPSGTPEGTPPHLYLFKVTSLDTGLELPFFTTSQGQTQQFNLTLYMLEGSRPKISVPVENLTLTGYNSTLQDAINWNNQDWNKSLVQKSVFNYSLSKNPITIQPDAANSTVITFQWADDAPVGRYTIDVNLGEFSFLSPPGKFDQSYREQFTLYIEVNPKTT
jgi:hypothetical protein